MTPQVRVKHVAALYDIHGNLPALEAVLAEVDALDCDAIVIGGDSALGPMPRQTLELLATRGERVRWIRGNCDREMTATLGPSPGASKAWGGRLRWAAEQTTPAQRELLATLPQTMTLEIAGLGAVLFCHGTPRSDEEIVTRITPADRLERILEGVAEGVVVCGHTHVQYDRSLGDRRVVNAGSVGMPYDERPGACWALLGPDVSLRRTVYDYARAAERIRASGFPEADAFAGQVASPPMTAAEASERFEKMAQERAAT